MRWHDHRLLCTAMSSILNLKGPLLDTLPIILRRVESQFAGKPIANNTLVDLRTEGEWLYQERPYYDLYPSVAEAFTKIDLSKVPCESVSLPLPNLMIRLAVGHELNGIRSILVSQSDNGSELVEGGKIVKVEGAKCWMIRINTGETTPARNNVLLPVHTVSGIVLKPGCTLSERLLRGREQPYCDDRDVDPDVVDTAARIVCAICMLAGDPDLIEPEPLEADRVKWEATHDMALIEKAGRRGKRAWAVGKHIEVAPGFRRPHFAIRWCGKGGTEPRLRPIRGCLVRRQAVVEVPTGFLGEEK